MTTEDAGSVLRDEGISRADSAADSVWKDAAEAVLDHLIATREWFTADDVWDELTRRNVEQPDEKRALAGMLVRARNAGRIEANGVRTSSHATRHRGYATVWKVIVDESRLTLNNKEPT